MLGRREGTDQTTLQTFGEKKQQQTQELKKSSASKARHTQLSHVSYLNQVLRLGLNLSKRESLMQQHDRAGAVVPTAGPRAAPSLLPTALGPLGFYCDSQPAVLSAALPRQTAGHPTSTFCCLETLCLSQHKHVSGLGGRPCTAAPWLTFSMSF